MTCKRNETASKGKQYNTIENSQGIRNNFNFCNALL